jgi:hypothetical protein
MSLDVYLTLDKPVKRERGFGIFIRENGATKEISREEWDRRFPGREPVAFRRDSEEESSEIYSSNITHNLGKMAQEVGIYHHLWRPDEIGIKKAQELIALLEAGLKNLKSDPDRYRQFNSPNGWGIYEDFVLFVEEYLNACRKYPDANIRVSR